jgi:magnesium chelatase family protein
MSGPLLDRIDLQIKVGMIQIGPWNDGCEHGSMSSEMAREKIQRAKDIQRARFKEKGKTNGDMTIKEVKEFIKLDDNARSFMDTIAQNHISPRAYYRIIKTARTIADLEGEEAVLRDHIAEAFGYRVKESL